MKQIFMTLVLFTPLLFTSAQPIPKDTIVEEKLQFHSIRINATDHTILPWYSNDLGESYDYIIGRIWNFWDTMRIDYNGLPYYMNHQVWKAEVNDTRGVAGSQFEMALNSWRLLYQYSGNARIKENMKFIADYLLSHSISPYTAEWPDLPYPYNTLAYSGIYDGDMVIGRNYTQPDKAGSFANELIHLYKLIGYGSHGQTPTGIYLESAIKIANTLSKHTISGNDSISPLPFKVHALLGKTGKITDVDGNVKEVQLYDYTTNWSGTLELFLNLIEMNKGNTKEYQKAFDTILNWMKKYPLQNNRWGPFFEDIVGDSDTQINAITFAQFMMNHPEYFPNWKQEVKGIFNWVYEKLGNIEWEKYGVIAVNEQTAFNVPGNSHTSRQASAELQYAALTGDQSFVKKAILQLNWATYMANNKGENQYLRDDIWLSDGYGDYVRHYLRAMAFMPELAPAGKNHLLSSSSIVQKINYEPDNISFTTFDRQSEVVFRLASKPKSITVSGKELTQLFKLDKEGYVWKVLEIGGILELKYSNGSDVAIKFF